MREELLQEHGKFIRAIEKWRTETILYRWLNIVLYLTCKFIVPTGALIIAVNMISIVMGEAIIGNFASSIIAVVVTLLASIEAMLNPGAKKRLAFTLNNELRSIENKMNLVRITGNEEELKDNILWADEQLKKLLNHYSENGY